MDLETISLPTSTSLFTTGTSKSNGTTPSTSKLYVLSFLSIHFNFMYVFSYAGGISSGNIFMSILLGLGTVGVLLLNTIAVWMSWATKQPEGFGEYQFLLF